MNELTCIVCPIGCSLSIEENTVAGGSTLTITGNRCSRGAVYAQEEIRAPRRVVTATCEIASSAEAGMPSINRPPVLDTAPRRIPVKTSAPCPKEMIDELLADIHRLTLNLPVKAGDRPILNWKDTGIDVVVTRNAPEWAFTNNAT